MFYYSGVNGMNLLRSETWRACAVLLAVLMSTGSVVAQDPAAAHTSPSHAIAPTVTADMGDPGGKFFGRPPDAARTRRYYIAAEPELWDFAPKGRDPVLGYPLPPMLAANRAGKIRYVQYTDASFMSKTFQPARLGILGPVLRGVVGDYLAVTFLNRSERPLSMHPHGVKYDKDSEGSYYESASGRGAAVGPGARFTYVWHLDDAAGPGPLEPSSKGWLYHSHVHGDEETNLGLIGSIIVTDPKRARKDGTPKDVDREQQALFMIFDESGLGEAEREAAEYASLRPGGAATARTWAQTQEAIEAGQRPTINGYSFGNTPGLEVDEGERVRWYLYALGSEKDMHTAHWHGLRVIEEGRRRTDVVELLPASMKVADMKADNPGSWLFHCHVSEHMMEGMFALVTVHPKSGVARTAGPAFFGVAEELQSLRITRAEARLDSKSGADVRISGVVTVFEAFSVFTQPITFELLGIASKFVPGPTGHARSKDAELQIRNAGDFGVVYGGSMEFDLTLKGRSWRDALVRHGVTRNEAPTRSIPLRMAIGDAVHTGNVALRYVGD